MLNHEAKKKKRKNPNFRYSKESVLLEKTRSTMKCSFTPIKWLLSKKVEKLDPYAWLGAI